MQNCALKVTLRFWILFCSSQICWYNVNKIRESRRSLFGSLLSEGKDYRMNEFSHKRKKNGSYCCIIYKENFVKVSNDEIAKYAKARNVHLSVSRSFRKFARCYHVVVSLVKAAISSKIFSHPFFHPRHRSRVGKSRTFDFPQMKTTTLLSTHFFLHFYIINEWLVYYAKFFKLSIQFFHDFHLTLNHNAFMN